MNSSIHYTVSLPLPQNHLFEVTLKIDKPDATGQRLRLPVWIPGSYLIRDFARHIVTLSAESAGHSCTVHKIDKTTWQVEPVEGELTVHYLVYAYDLSVRSAYLDHTRGFFNGSSVFLAVVGQENKPSQVQIVKPEHLHYAGWKVATSLPRLGKRTHEFGVFYAEDYDALIDHPVELGEFDVYQFQVEGVVHELVISGQYQVNQEQLLKDIEKICRYQIQLFGGKAPFDYYVFLLLLTANDYGGLEHRSSSALIFSRDELSEMKEKKDGCTGYQHFLGLVSHEYFHSWNVKRIKPQVFSEYDLTQENYTRLLWAFEGVTSYYETLTLVRTGLLSVEDYLVMLSKTLSSLLRNPGSQVQTLEEASFDAWIKYYRQDENSLNTGLSYYTKGAIVALLLDATIRQRTNGKSSLDEVMLALWQRYGECFEVRRQGVAEREWEEVACQVSGVDLREFFDRLLRSTDPMPLKETLAYLGIEYQEQIARNSQDLGGIWEDEKRERIPSLGVRFVPAPLGVKVTHVLSHSPAELAGLSAQDIVVAMDGLEVKAATFEKKVALYQPNDQIELYVLRREVLMNLSVTIFAYSRPICALRMKSDIKHTHAAQWLGLSEADVNHEKMGENLHG